MRKTVFLWDIDGTLLLTGGVGKIAFNRAFEKLFHEHYIWFDLNPDGKTDDWIIDQLFLNRFQRVPTSSERKELTHAYQQEMKIALYEVSRFRLMPHVIPVLEKLSRQAHVALGLATGNFKTAAFHKLDRGGLSHYFLFGGYGCDSPDRLKLTQIALKRAIEYLKSEPDAVYLVGDTVEDIRCGKQIGAKTIGVCTGATTRDQLLEAKANWVLNDLSEWGSLTHT